MDFEQPAKIRIGGMAIPVDTADESKISDRGRKSGLLLTISGNGLMMFPALTLDRRSAKVGLDIDEKSLC